MDIDKNIEVEQLEEVTILYDVRLINAHDLNPRTSKDNLSAQFVLSGEVRGVINCYLCLDNKDLGHTDRNYLFPLFIESMNILIGKQMSLDPVLKNLKMNLSTPRISLNPITVNTSGVHPTHLYNLQLDETSYDVLIQYSLEMMN
ncbi:MAG: hypothetical protein WDA09_03270 [Bacteriovoracaceae bacterium]